MTTATDHKNNLNRSTIKKTFSRTLRVETIANSAGGTAAVAMVAQPSTGFLNGHFYADGSPTEDTEDCLGRITVGLTVNQVQISHHSGFSPGHDRVDWHGTSTSYPRLWNQRFTQGHLDVGLALLPWWPTTRKHQPNGTMVTEPSSPLGHSQPPLQHQQPTCPKHAIQAHPCQSIQLRLAHSRQACNAWPQRSCQGRLASLGAYTGLAFRWNNPFCICSRPLISTHICLSICLQACIMCAAVESCSNPDPIKR